MSAYRRNTTTGCKLKRKVFVGASPSQRELSARDQFWSAGSALDRAHREFSREGSVFWMRTSLMRSTMCALRVFLYSGEQFHTVIQTPKIRTRFYRHTSSEYARSVQREACPHRHLQQETSRISLRACAINPRSAELNHCWRNPLLSTPSRHLRRHFLMYTFFQCIWPAVTKSHCVHCLIAKVGVRRASTLTDPDQEPTAVWGGMDSAGNCTAGM